MPPRLNPEAPLYIVMCDYERGPRSANVEEGYTRHELVQDVLDGQYEDIAYIAEVFESRSRDISEDIAREVVVLAEKNGSDIHDDLHDWCLSHRALPEWSHEFKGGRSIPFLYEAAE